MFGSFTELESLLSNKFRNITYPLVAFAGPSGVGKSTIISKILSDFPSVFGVRVSNTTRTPRPNEKDGIHYIFTPKIQMEKAIAEGRFLEWAKVHNNYYGTSFQSIIQVLNSDRICILDIDIQGCKSIKATNLHNRTKFIFIKPPSPEFLENRLRRRETETEETIKTRMKTANDELKFVEENSSFFNNIIVHKELAETIPFLYRSVLAPELELLQANK